MRPIIADTAAQEVVDALAAAIDIDRGAEVRRVQRALEPFGLDEAFSEELRLSGVPSVAWRCCMHCSGIIDDFETSREAA